MSGDVDIDGWLGGEGFDLPEGKALARSALEAAGLTRSGRARMSTEKVARARALLAERTYLHCSMPACVAAAQASGRTPVLTAA